MILSLSKTLAHYLVQGLGQECTSLGFPFLVDLEVRGPRRRECSGKS